MARLRKFEFNEGTMDNPIVLSQDHVNALISLWADENVEKSINGVVYKETLYDSEKDALEDMGFTVLVGAQLEDQFSISPVLEYINEGESTNIEADGINAAALKFEIMEVKITYDGDNLGEDYIKSKIGFDFNVLKVASAKENSSWIAEVTFKAYPQAHPINYRTGKVTVNAVGINNVVIQGESMLNERDTAIYTGQVLPENNTKTFSKIVFSAKYGHFRDNLYSAPTGFASDVITATVSAYNRAYSGTKSIIIGAVILNDTDKNSVVFNAVKAGLKSAGWTTLGSQPIDSATEMTSIDAYRVTSSDFNKILPNLKNISVDYSFDEGEYFVNVTSIDVNNDNDNFGPNLTSINMSNLNTISYSAQGDKGLFKNCTKLSNVVLNGLITINRQNRSTTETDKTFYNCTSLVTINLPNLNSIEGIYNQGNLSTFENCSKLKNVYLPKLNTIRNTYNGNMLIRIFANCKSLEFIELPNLVSINGINNMFDGCENLIAASFPKLTDIVDTSTVFAGMFNNCSKLRSVNFSSLTKLSNRQLFANTSIKNYVGNNEYGFDEFIDGEDKILDWSKTKLINLDNVDSMFKNTMLFKYVLPSTLNKLTGFNILSNSKIGIVDLRKCRNVNTVDAVFNDNRDYLQLYKLYFLRFSSSTPPHITDTINVPTGKRITLGCDAPVFCPTSYFNNYKNDTILNNLFYPANSHNKIKILEYMQFNWIGIESSFNTISLLMSNSKIELIVEGQRSNNRATIFIIGDRNNGIAFGNNNTVSFLVNNSTVWSGTGKYKIILENNIETTKVSIYNVNNGLLFENNYTFSNNVLKFKESNERDGKGQLYSIKRYVNSELVNNIVPAFDVNNSPCLYDTVSNIIHRPNANMIISVDGTVQNSITVETNYSGTYDEIRSAYEQYLIDNTTECPWERGVSVNRLFPDEMMDWMCKSIFGFNKSWSGDLEDIPVELL